LQPLGVVVHHDGMHQIIDHADKDDAGPTAPAMPPTAVSETVALLEALSRRAAELAAVLPALDLGAEDLAALAGEVQRINARLADAEERVALAGPGECRG
jgi:hypothetical protein